MSDDNIPVCIEAGCGVEKTDGHGAYSPIQVIMGQPLGWYSGDDGEICPKHIAEMMALGNRQRYQYLNADGTAAVTA